MEGMTTARHWGMAWDWSFGALEERGQMTNIERVISDLTRETREGEHVIPENRTPCNFDTYLRCLAVERRTPTPVVRYLPQSWSTGEPALAPCYTLPKGFKRVSIRRIVEDGWPCTAGKSLWLDIVIVLAGVASSSTSACKYNGLLIDVAHADPPSPSIDTPLSRE